MSRCYMSCKYNSSGYYLKYDEKVIKSKNFYHPHLLIHPLQYLSIYYNENKDNVEYLVKIAKEHLNNDKVVNSICDYFSQHGQISFKQRKLLLHKIFDCFEEKE